MGSNNEGTDQDQSHDKENTDNMAVTPGPVKKKYKPTMRAQ